MRPCLLLGLALGALWGSGPASAAPDAARGAKLFSDQCSMCHSLAAGENGMGPSLHGVYEASTGHASNFAYSAGLASHKARWTDANLDRFLSDPQAFSPGSQMPVSIPAAADRADLIAYLKTAR
jgi:cytochrome c